MGTWTDPHEVLNIPRGSEEQKVKIAYRKSLLSHHPDKVQHGDLKYTIDDINEAYRQLRRELTNEAVEIHSDIINFNEIVDLADCEESEMSDGSIQWTRGCRCGQDAGYVLLERDLELNGDADEIAIQCQGCSIWILVQYSIE